MSHHRLIQYREPTLGVPTRIPFGSLSLHTGRLAGGDFGT